MRRPSACFRFRFSLPAINKHKAAEAVFERALTALGKVEVKGSKRQVATAHAREVRTSNASLVELKRLCRTRPTTAEGLVAMLKHLERLQWRDGPSVGAHHGRCASG
jgi:hypothetical protein